MTLDPSKYDFSQLLAMAQPKKINPPKFAWFTIIATWFWVGLFPLAPGTVGSIAVYPIYHVVIESAQDVFRLGAISDAVFKFWLWTIFLFIIGWIAVAKFQEKTKSLDASMVVIDEVVGMLVAIALCFNPAYKIALKFNPFGHAERNVAFFIILVFFRFFDIYKPLIISAVDKYYKKPLGVMLDDILAGIFTAATVYGISKIVT